MRKIKINKTVIDEVTVTPCFNCNSDECDLRDATINSGSTLHHVYCFNCGCTGPGVFTEEEAIQGWNVLHSYCNSGNKNEPIYKPFLYSKKE